MKSRIDSSGSMISEYNKQVCSNSNEKRNRWRQTEGWSTPNEYQYLQLNCVPMTDLTDRDEPDDIGLFDYYGDYN